MTRSVPAGGPSDTVPANGGWAVDIGAEEYTGTRVKKTVSGTGELLFGGQVKSKVNVTTQGSLSAVDITVHPNESHSVGWDSVKRWYGITATGSGATFDLTLSYKDSELSGETEGTLNLWRWADSMWYGPIVPAQRDTSNNWLKATGQNSFSDWVMSDTAAVAPVPELPTIALVGAGLAVLAGYFVLRKHRKIRRTNLTPS